MNKYLISFALGTSILLGAEVSVFGAGNLDSKEPYGLNNTEKYILKNQNKIKNVSSDVNDLKSTIDSMNSRLEGLESIFQGDSQKLNSTVLKINEISDKSLQTSTDIEDLRNVTSQLLTLKEESDKQVNSNIQTLKDALAKLSDLVNKINSQYVSESNFKNNMNQFVTRAEFEALKKVMGVSNSSGSSKSTSNSNSSQDKAKALLSKVNLSSDDKEFLMAEAKKEFDRMYFKYAIPIYEKLLEINYKPAESSFHLGEMWFVRKKYDTAISYFKKSAMLYDKASWMPTLLLHSAISFEKIGDKENAKSFYSTLIDLYPSSNEASEAKQNLNKL
jgi:TolA-binding protein